MTFLAPYRLWLFAAVAVLVVVYAVMQFRRRKYAVRFTNMALLDQVAPKRPGWRRHIPAIVFLMAISALVVGFAQPARDTKVPRERATIMMAIDTSLSMEATDVAPSRLEAATRAARSFVEDLPSPLEVGLVTFDATQLETDGAAHLAKIWEAEAGGLPPDFGQIMRMVGNNLRSAINVLELELMEPGSGLHKPPYTAGDWREERPARGGNVIQMGDLAERRSAAAMKAWETRRKMKRRRRHA